MYAIRSYYAMHSHYQGLFDVGSTTRASNVGDRARQVPVVFGLYSYHRVVEVFYQLTLMG